MIRRELGIWRRLEDPNIVPFLGIAYGFGSKGEHASLVSLWMDNGSLQGFLRKYDDRLTIAHRLQLNVYSSPCIVHSFKPDPIIHGDLSSSNVLLDRNYVARLTDFGYASMIGDIPEVSLYLQMSTMKTGTIRFTAPDLFLADEEQKMQPTTQSDIYSFGCLGLLASVLSGKRPWSECSNEKTVIGRLSHGKKPKRPLSRPIENNHWELIEHCWSSVCDRPVAEAVVSSLQQFLCSHPLTVPLVDICRAPKDNVHELDASEATLGDQTAVSQDGKCILPTPGLISSRPDDQTLQTLSLHMTSWKRQIPERRVIISSALDLILREFY
ncbi:kinase-like domain-containing protein [Boletus edulis]|nr:kinase-like domain-containing protein [Boletus edulis]